MLPLSGLFCLLIGCGNSLSYGNEGIKLPGIPAYVSQQRGLVAIPTKPLDEQGTRQLIIQLRKSEIRKNRALGLAIRERQVLVERWAKPANRSWLNQGSPSLRWPGDE